LAVDDLELNLHEAMNEEVTEEVNLKENKIPQLDGMQVSDTEKVSELLEFELKVKAHEACKNYDVIENIEVNYDGTLDDLKIDKNNTARKILVQKVNKEIENDDKELEADGEVRHVLVYRVFVKNCEISRKVIESWKDRYEFEDLAFRSAVYGKINVTILEVLEL
jgi:hypothetical protein